MPGVEAVKPKRPRLRKAESDAICDAFVDRLIELLDEAHERGVRAETIRSVAEEVAVNWVPPKSRAT